MTELRKAMQEVKTNCWLQNQQQTWNQKQTKKKHLTSFQLSEIIVEKEIKTRTELLFLPNEQKMEGKTDIAEFVVNWGPKVVAEVLNTAWELNTAQDHLSRSKKSQIDILREAQSTECVPECNGMWLTCAKQVLQQNGINLPGHSRTLWKNLFTRDKENAEILWLSGLPIAGKLSSWTLWALFTIPFAIPRVVRLLGLVLNTPNASSWMISGGLSKSFPGMTSF